MMVEWYGLEKAGVSWLSEILLISGGGGIIKHEAFWNV